MANLDEILKQLTNPAPKYEDPEEDEGDVTRATLLTHDLNADDDVEVDTSQLRRLAAFDDNDARYKGKKASRRDLFDFTGEAEDRSNEEIDSDEVERMEEEEGRDDGDESGQDNEEAGDDEEESGEEEDESDEEIVSDEVGSNQDDEEAGADDTEGMMQFSAANQEDEVAKGKAVVAQLELWDRLMEGRINLQKVLVSVNAMPKPETLQQWKEENPQLLVEIQAQLQTLLSALLQLQAKLLCANSETKNIATSASADRQSSKHSHDEEEEGEAISAKRFAGFQMCRNDTIKKWDDNTRLGSKLKSFSAFNTSVLKQIEQVMSDKDRLVKRTQINRSSKSTESKVEAAYDTEVFNDDDFYHILLRELIERKNDSSDTTDITRQWLEIQRMRSSVKKKTVDTRASKGRKLRYNIHKKMVNFMAPVDTSSWSTEAKDDLFKSLFKGASTVEL